MNSITVELECSRSIAKLQSQGVYVGILTGQAIYVVDDLKGMITTKEDQKDREIYHKAAMTVTDKPMVK